MLNKMIKYTGPMIIWLTAYFAGVISYATRMTWRPTYLVIYFTLYLFSLAAELLTLDVLDKRAI